MRKWVSAVLIVLGTLCCVYAVYPILEVHQGINMALDKWEDVKEDKTPEEEKAERMLTQMYRYFIEHCDKMPETYVSLLKDYPREQVVCDYISSMTDTYAVYMFNAIFVPKGWNFSD